MHTYVFLFCDNPSIDPVAPHILSLAIERYAAVQRKDCAIAGKPVFEAAIGADARYVFAPTRTVPSYQHHEIADDLNRLFPEACLISVVNWHGGNNAPERIFCAHTTADVARACFPPCSSVMLSAVLRAIEEVRKERGLDQWRTLVEATHWSGTMEGRPPSDLYAIKAPVIDVEIGSYPNDWSEVNAHQVVAEALGRIPANVEEGLPSLMFLGGMHFEPALTEALLAQRAPIRLGLVLPNQWLVQGRYEGDEGAAKVMEAAKSSLEPLAGLCFHDNLKSCYKTAIKHAGTCLGIPVFNHRKLRDMEFLKELVARQTSGAE